MEIIPITEIKKSRIAEVMIKIFLSGATYQFLNAGFGIIRLKYFLDSNGPNAMGEIASIVAIWGLMTILTEDFRHLLRTKNIESSGLVKDTKLSLGLNIRAKAPIIIISLAAITTTDGSTISSFNVLTISIFLIGYFLTIINCSLIGVLEANNQYVKLNFLQIFFAIANFILFFPIVYYCSSLGFLANLIITSNFIAFPLYFVVRKICQEQYFTFDRPLTLSKISSSKIYLYVLALQTSSYVFDPLIILHLASNSEAVEYSLIRRIGLIMTVSTLSLGPYFSSLGSRQLTKLPKLRMNLLSIALISTFLYLVVSTQVIGLVFRDFPENLWLYQLGMVLLGLSSIKTSAQISSFSSEYEIMLRFKVLLIIVPSFLMLGAVGVFVFGGFFPLYSGALFLIAYEYTMKVMNETD